MKHARPDYNRFQDPDGKIPEDEPVFLIRGQDQVGYLVVKIWALLNESYGGDPLLTKLANSHAQLMEDWPKKKPSDI